MGRTAMLLVLVAAALSPASSAGVRLGHTNRRHAAPSVDKHPEVVALKQTLTSAKRAYDQSTHDNKYAAVETEVLKTKVAAAEAAHALKHSTLSVAAAEAELARAKTLNDAAGEAKAREQLAGARAAQDKAQANPATKKVVEDAAKTSPEMPHDGVDRLLSQIMRRITGEYNDAKAQYAAQLDREKTRFDGAQDRAAADHGDTVKQLMARVKAERLAIVLKKSGLDATKSELEEGKVFTMSLPAHTKHTHTYTHTHGHPPRACLFACTRLLPPLATGSLAHGI